MQWKSDQRSDRDVVLFVGEFSRVLLEFRGSSVVYVTRIRGLEDDCKAVFIGTVRNKCR